MDLSSSIGLDAPVGTVPASEVLGRDRERSLRDWTAGSLFPPAPARTGARWPSVVFGVLFVAAASAASLLRQSGIPAVNSIWGEDGHAYYQQVFRQGYLAALFTPWNGYLNLVPRLLIGVLGHLPVAHVAEAFAVTGAVAGSLVALSVYHGSAGHMPSRVMRLCIAIPTAVIMFGQLEVGNSIVNIQWYLMFGCFWMLLWTPRTVWGRAVAALILCTAIGSDPMTACFIPLLAVRLWALPWRASLWQAGGLLLGGVYQAVGFLQGDASTRPAKPKYSLEFAEVGYRKLVISDTFVSPHELSYIGYGTAHMAEVAGLAALIVIAVLGAVFTRPNWFMAGVCLLFSVGFFSAVAMQGNGYAPRYGMVPVLLLICAGVFLAAPPARRAAGSADAEATAGIGGQVAAPPRKSGFLARSGPLALVPAAVLCIVVGLNFAASYSGGSWIRDNAPSWSTEVHLGHEACLKPGAQTATLITAPGNSWTVAVPCSELRRS